MADFAEEFLMKLKSSAFDASFNAPNADGLPRT
jgi:hypothetical protein